MSVDPQRVIQTVLDESVLIDKQGIVALYDAVRKMMGFGLGALLYRAGKIGGQQGAELLAGRLGLAGDDLLEALVLAFNASRWGQARLARGGTRWHLVVHDSVLATRIRSKKPVCHPIAGYWAGFLQVALGTEVEVREVQCAATGAEACVFEVRRKTR
ncbi:MAG: hypothetical protein GXO37_04225 [Chloroflexi bacterium]|nr:hypothetical protein [Chloroflexota bacterium]